MFRRTCAVSRVEFLFRRVAPGEALPQGQIPSGRSGAIHSCAKSRPMALGSLHRPMRSWCVTSNDTGASAQCLLIHSTRFRAFRRNRLSRSSFDLASSQQPHFSTPYVVAQPECESHAPPHAAKFSERDDGVPAEKAADDFYVSWTDERGILHARSQRRRNGQIGDAGQSIIVGVSVDSGPGCLV
jgi:hypothetical protein